MKIRDSLKLPIVYIAGSIVGKASGKDVEQVVKKNIEEAKKYALVLAENEVGFFLPHLNTIKVENWDINQAQRFYYNLDAQFLVRLADAFMFLPGWEDSYGARTEHELIKTLNEILKQHGLEPVPVFYPKALTEEELKPVIDWCKQNDTESIEDKLSNLNLTKEEETKIKSTLAKFTSYIFGKPSLEKVA